MLKSVLLVGLATACLAIPLAEEPSVPTSGLVIPPADVRETQPKLPEPSPDFVVPPPVPFTSGIENQPPSRDEPEAPPNGEKPQDSDLKTDSTFWWGYRRPYYYRSYYRPRVYYSYYTPYYHDHYDYWW